MEDIVLPSGAKLNITIASFDDVMELQTVIGEAMGKFQMPSDLAGVDMSLSGILSSPALLAELTDKIKAVGTSRAVRAAVMRCFERCTYNGARLNKQLFDDPKLGDAARADYYTIFMKVLEANCKPFFAQTFSALSSVLKTPPATPT
jgi:hypothetical protein